jgi:hypothetical protein
MATSEFGDGARYCRAVEAAYVEMWERWCREQSSRVGPQGENGTLSAARGFVDALPTSR